MAAASGDGTGERQTLLSGHVPLAAANPFCVQLGSRLSPEEPLPYLVYQPLPWQIQRVSQSRRTSRDSEKGRSSRQNSTYSISGEKGNVAPEAGCEGKFFSDPEKAAVPIQTHFRRYQQQKQGKK